MGQGLGEGRQGAFETACALCRPGRFARQCPRPLTHPIHPTPQGHGDHKKRHGHKHDKHEAVAYGHADKWEKDGTVSARVRVLGVDVDASMSLGLV